MARAARRLPGIRFEAPALPLARVNVDRLLRQARTGGVIPFVGAGMSVPFKFPQWKEFLIGNAPDRATRAHIGRLVDAGKYEEAAAVLLRARGGNGLQDIIEATFGTAALSETPTDAAVLLLPDLCSGPVLTTNFDAVLEKTFQGANRPFDGVIVGMLVDDLRRALQERSRVLVHLHGVATDRTNRVLTMQDYRRRYANAAPLEAFLRVVVTQPVLFLGCSLITTAQSAYSASSAQK